MSRSQTPPTETSVEVEIARSCLATGAAHQAVDVPEHDVELEARGKIEERAHRDLVLRAGIGMRQVLVEIPAAGVEVEVGFQERVTRCEPPRCDDRPVGCDLESIGLPIELVAIDDRHHGSLARRRALRKRMPEFKGLEAVVVVVERGDVDERLRREAGSVTKLVGEQLLGREIVRSQEANDRALSGIGGVAEDVAFETCRRPNGAGDSAPERLAGDRIPGYSPTRLHFETAEVVVLELRSPREAERLAQERDLILDEAAEQLIVGTGGDQGDALRAG